ncbi:MAG: hypothetical protein AB7K68_04125 [Bacteriovoracia bacterium]
MKKSSPDLKNQSMNEKPSVSSGQADDAFGGRHGGREDIRSRAGEENLLKNASSPEQEFNRGNPKRESPEQKNSARE